MKKIYSDIHNFSAKETPTKLSYDNNSVYLGDIWDVHCLKKDVFKMIAASDKHRHKCDMSKGVINVRGNHEGKYGHGLSEYVIQDRILYCHGHTPFYSKKAKVKWYNKDAGISKWKFYGIKMTNMFRNFNGNKVSSEKLTVLARYALDHFCHTVVAGHLHREHDGIVEIVSEGVVYKIRVIVVNCGMTEKEI